MTSQSQPADLSYVLAAMAVLLATGDGRAAAPERLRWPRTTPRQQAAKLFAKGKSQADVARELEVSRQSVSRWYGDWQAKGTTGLAGAGRAGRLPKLDAAQLGQVAQELAKALVPTVTRLSCGPWPGWARS